jgi:hypothetical protein
MPHATAVEGNHWLTDHILVTLHDDGTLERIDTATGERASLASHVTGWLPGGDDIHFLIADSPNAEDDGLWYLSAAALGLSAPAAQSESVPAGK